MAEGDTFITVQVSIEMLAELEQDWSRPVQIQIERTSGGTGYVMNARTHTCEPCTCPHISEVDDYCPQHGRGA